MSFTLNLNIASIIAKMNALAGLLPAIGAAVQAAEALLPGAPGLTKAGLVIDTLTAAEPALASIATEIGAAVSGVVTAFRSVGTLPTATPTPAAAPAADPAPATATATASV